MSKISIVGAAAAAWMTLGTMASAQETPATPSPAAPSAPVTAAEPTPAVAAPAPAATPAPPAPATVPGQAKGKIVFFRPSSLVGAVYTYHIVEVGDDGKPAKDAPHLGDLKNGGGFTVEVDAGVHAYNITGPMAVNKAVDRLRMDVEPGETYYVEQQVRMGAVTGGFRLIPSDEARYKAKVKQKN